MTNPIPVEIYLSSTVFRQHENGQFNFLNLVLSVLKDAEIPTTVLRKEPGFDFGLEQQTARSLVYMTAPLDERGLTFRKTYIAPFWRIETQAKRWKFDVARSEFETPQDVVETNRFFNAWRKRLFSECDFEQPRQGTVYVPLQGVLRDRRSFQSCSPIEMLKTVLATDTNRDVVATLHPKEKYDDADQHALAQLMAHYPRLQVEMGNMQENLMRCDYVVTQNSSAGLMGYFFHKPLVLFGKSDFHHIALNVDDMGARAAIKAAPDHRPDFAAYVYWFLQQRSISAGRPDAKSAIRRRFVEHGWI